jgi:prepilin-type N-terminal cleavage/methylation domain-containing protein
MNAHARTHARARTRRGFTLLEVLVAIALTAIVTAIAASALDAARRASDAVTRDRETAEADARVRALLTDMLRHAPTADAVDEPLLQLGPDAPLVFLSRGVVQPFGTGRTWRVTLHGDSSGVSLDAIAIGRGLPLPALHAALPQYAGFAASVLEGSASSGRAWRTDWPLQRARPALLRIAFRGRGDGATPASPLVVALESPLSGAAR